MSRIKKAILIILPIIIVLLIIIVVLHIINVNRQKNYIGDPPTEDPDIYLVDTNLKQVNVRNDFYVVKTCVEKYYAYIADYNFMLKNSESFSDELIEEALNMVNDLFYSREQIEDIDRTIVTINKMYVSEQTTDISAYVVFGNLRDEATSNITKFELMVIVDKRNNTFSIAQWNSELRLGEPIKLNIEQIERKTYNVYQYKNIDDETVAIDYFSLYRLNMIYNVEEAYNLLDEEYREKRFGNLEKYKEYVKDNLNIILDKYQISKKDGYIQYVCIDKNGNYYICKETSVMDYKVLLDTYTVDIPEFTEKYNKSTNEQKAGLNIQKFIEAINQKDYSYAYSKIADGFKDNYFQTQKDFETYMKGNFSTDIKLAVSEVIREGDLYICTASLNNIQKQFIVKLNEGTEFELSFDI